MPGNASRPQPSSFEEAFARLEGIVQRLEQGNLSLEESTRLYEEGITLARLCNELLNKVELRITRLQTSYGQQMRLAGEGEANEEDEDEEPPPQG
ncbi:Exodeoxyribonuclease 7 small subunit [bacterium HR23]|nr:Exodeoxyribonuclease 7 small subunit [bacterium HR23]